MSACHIINGSLLSMTTQQTVNAYSMYSIALLMQVLTGLRNKGLLKLP
jgi:hypothetical protein